MRSEQVESVMNQFFSSKKIILYAALGIGALVLIIISIVGMQSFVNQTEPLFGSGTMALSSRDISQVRSVELRVPGTVTIDKSDTSKLIIQADDNFMDCFVITDADRKLIISQKDTCQGKTKYMLKPVTELKISIQSPSIERIVVASSANVTAVTPETTLFEAVMSGSGTLRAGVTTPKLDAKITGSGTMTFTGDAFEQVVNIEGSGSFDGRELKGKVADVTLTGSGSVITSVTDVLKVHGSGSGGVYFINNPTITKELSGSGIVRQYKSQ